MRSMHDEVGRHLSRLVLNSVHLVDQAEYYRAICCYAYSVQGVIRLMPTAFVAPTRMGAFHGSEVRVSSSHALRRPGHERSPENVRGQTDQQMHVSSPPSSSMPSGTGRRLRHKHPAFRASSPSIRLALGTGSSGRMGFRSPETCACQWCRQHRRATPLKK